MKYILFIFLLVSSLTFSQVKVGDNPDIIDSNSILELESSNKVLVVTRLTTAQINALTPLNGSIVYNTDLGCLFQYNNNSWNSLCIDVMANETVTSLIDNNDGSISYTNESNTVTIISKAALIDNGNGTYTFSNGNGSSIDLDVSALETVTAIVENTNGTFSYTDENGSITNIDITNLETLTSITLNADNTNIDYIDENGNTTQLNLFNLVKNLETLTIVEDTNDGRYIHTNEAGTNTIINTNASTNPYNNSTSGLSAINVQTAIDELVANSSDNQALITDNTPGHISIESGNSLTLNVDDADADTTNELQNLNNTVVTPNESLEIQITNGTNTTIDIRDADSNTTNELQDISLTGALITLSNPATVGNNIDLTKKITLPMLADATANNDEIVWDGTQWVYRTSVKTVNLSAPDADGNINIPIGNVYTGPTTSTSDISTIEIGGTPQEGDIYVINSDASNPAEVGKTYIYDADSTTWIEIDPFNAALYDPRYVNVTGDTMVGNLDMNGNTVTDLGLPNNPSDAATKSYVDNIDLVDNNNGTFTLNKADGTTNIINKADVTANTDGTYVFTNGDGSDVIINTNASTNPYNNSSSGLTANNVQEAIDELTTGSTDNQNLSTNNNPGHISIESGNSLTLNVDDADADATNEIQNVTSNDGSVTVTQSGNDFNLAVTPFDASTLQNQISTNTNSISTNASTITNIQTEQTTQNTNIANNTSAINAHNTADFDLSATNEIQNVTSNDGSVTVTQSGNDFNLAVTPFDASPLQNQITTNTNSISANATNITNNTSAINAHNNADLDLSATNEIQNVTSNDGSVTVTQSGNDFNLAVTPFDANGLQNQITSNTDNISTNTSAITNIQTEQTTQNTNITNNTSAINAHNTADLDLSATNEIQNVTSNDGSVTVTQSGNDFNLAVTPFDASTLQNQITTNTNNISTNASAITNIQTEQITQNTNIANNTSAFNAHNTADQDLSSTNEIQNVTSNDGSVTVTQSGNDFDLAVTPFDASTLQNQISTNTNSISTNATNITNNTSAINAHNTADLDLSATNEIQNVTSNDGSVTVTQSGNDFNLAVTSFDASTLQNQITTNTNSISTNTSAITNIQTEQTTQNTNISNNTSAINAHNTADLDLSATNEITTVTDNMDGTTTITDVNGGSIVLDNDGVDNVDDADADTTNELQNLNSTVVTPNESLEIQITNGTNTTIDIRDADSNTTNELQDISLTGALITLSNPATVGNNIDLTKKITLPMLADATANNDEIVWDGTQWVYRTSVKTVNLSAPDADGNINIPIGNVYTGPTTSTSDISTIEIGGTPQEGDIYVINSDASNPAEVGKTYIYDADSTTWIEIDPFNAALYDPRYVNVTGDTMVGNLDMNGNTVTDLGLPNNPSDAATKSYVDNIDLVDNNNGTFTLNKADGTTNIINKADVTANTDGTYVFTNGDGSDVIINTNASTNPYNNSSSGLTANNVQEAIDELTTGSTDNQNLSTNNNPGHISIESGNSLTLNVDDADADATNEIQNVTSNDGSVTVTQSGNDFNLAVTPFDASTLQSQISTNTNNISTNASTITNIQTEQTTQNTNITNNTSAINAHNTADLDLSATNEIQNVTSNDGSVTITQSGNDFNLAVTPFDASTLQNQISTNTNSISTNATNITNNTSAINAHNTADLDLSATNEIQNVTSNDGSVTVTQSGNDFNLAVTPFDANGLQSQITSNTDNISTNTSAITNIQTEQTTQNTNIANNTSAINAHNTADLDLSATNEIQNVTSNDGSVTVTQSGNDFNLAVTPFDASTLQNQITTNTNNISTNASAITNIQTEQITQNTNIANNTSAFNAHNTADQDLSPTNEIQNVTSNDGSVTITQSGNDFNLAVSIPNDNDNDATNELGSYTDTTTGNKHKIGEYKNQSTATNVDVNETATTLSQNDTSLTGEITYINESGTTSTAQVVAAETDNNITVGANGGAYLGPSVYTGTFIISGEGLATVTGIPFQPSQVTFVANANVESLNIDSDNGTGNNDRGIDNSFGTMNGFAKNTGGTLTQQVMYIGGHGNSINNISRYASNSNCIGIRYGDYNGSSLGKIEGSLNSFTTDGFTINVNYTDGVITSNNGNPLVNVQPDDIDNESLLVIFTAYK